MIKIRQLILFFGDLILIYLALFLTIIIGFGAKLNWQIVQQHFFAFSILYLFWFSLLYILGLYELNLIQPKIELLTKIVQFFLISLMISLVFFYLIPLFNITPKTNLLINSVFFNSFIFGWRRIFYYFFSSRFVRNLAFLGQNELVNSLIKEINLRPQFGYRFVKFLEPQKSLLAQLKNESIDNLIITENFKTQKKLIQKLYQCLPLRITLWDVSQAYEKIFFKIPLEILDENWFLKNLREDEKKIYEKIKRISEFIFAFLILFLTIPVWLLISLLIKLEDRGSIFYTQKRMGKDGKEFLTWKFRSMKPGAEKKLGSQGSQEENYRLTNIGKFLRRTHLDELPQLLNVLKGDISLIGPRPEKLEFAKTLERKIPHYRLRQIVKPGLTGWAQIKFRYAYSVKDFQEKFQYDLYYIKNRSLFLDLGIFLKTLLFFFKRNELTPRQN